MDRKTAIWVGLSVGSVVGQFVPSLWGASLFSVTPVIFSAIGGFLGIWIGYTYGQ